MFLGYEDFVDIFGGYHKIGLYLGGISMHLGTFLEVKVQRTEYQKIEVRMGDIFGC